MTEIEQAVEGAVVISTRIEFRQDEQAYWKDRPCRGCVDYCDDYGNEQELVEVYGHNKCAGQSFIRQVTVWAITLKIHYGREDYIIVGEHRDDIASAVLEAKTKFAVDRLNDHR